MRHHLLPAAMLLLTLGLCHCKKTGAAAVTTTKTDTTKTDTTTAAVADTFIYKGADVSWLTQMEDSGYKFYDSAGASMDGMQLMKSLGINSIRLRVWVNPAMRYNGIADVVAKAVRAKNLGLRVLIDFHYSDTWADPGDQTTPAAWASFDAATLADTVYSYTQAVLDSLQANAVVPSWVQVGNETNNGMLWPVGNATSSMANFAALVSAGYRAVKSISDTIQVIVHISNGYDNSLFRWVFDGLKANGAQWDIIGMSLYPSAANWVSYNDSCLSNMNDMVSRYGKSVMICEVGMPENEATTCESFIADLIHKVKLVSGGKGLGVFYWEPESYNNWQGYGLGAFDNTGKPTVAMDAFAN